MQKLWRRELVKGPFMFNNTLSGIYTCDSDKRTEGQYVEEISRVIKIFKRKQELYFRMVETFESQGATKFNPEGTTSAEMSVLKMEHEKNLADELNAIAALKVYRNESYYESKTYSLGQMYLYTVFMRISELIETSRQKAKIQAKRQLERIFDQQKQKMHECYHNLTYFGTFNLIQILETAKNTQNDRISKYIPKKKIPYHKPPPPVFQIERVKSLQSRELSRTSASKIEMIVRKKLIGAYSKELPSAQNKRQRPLRISRFTVLYKILAVKIIKIEDFQLNRWDIQEEAMSRNQKIFDERRKWEKQYQEKVKGFRSKVRSKNQGR